MSELGRFYKVGDPDRLASVVDERDRHLVLAAREVISRYVAACCVATGMLQLLAIAKPRDGAVAWSEFHQTPSKGKVSVRTVGQHMRSRASSWVSGRISPATAQIIRDRLAGPNGCDPDKQRSGRR